MDSMYNLNRETLINLFGKIKEIAISFSIVVKQKLYKSKTKTYKLKILEK